MNLVRATRPRGAHHSLRSGGDPARHRLRCRRAARLTRLWREQPTEPYKHWPAGRSGRQRYRRMRRANRYVAANSVSQFVEHQAHA
jgi:hypothetical protein